MIVIKIDFCFRRNLRFEVGLLWTQKLTIRKCLYVRPEEPALAFKPQNLFIYTVKHLICLKIIMSSINYFEYV